MDSITRKREQEKRVVSEMIAPTVISTTAQNMDSVTIAPPLRSMRAAAAIIVHLWRRKPFAPTAVYIAINRKCERRFAK